MKAAILTIGTEITDGQIIDKNSQWISEQLNSFHIKTILHLSVPDLREEMLSAISFINTKADFIFICGGLGPTSDDFTRDVISEAFALELQLNSEIWDQIQQKISGRGITIREGHKRQALFPKTSIPLSNSVGVAPGFYLEHSNKKIWVLPGPPHEIAAIWNSHILPNLTQVEPDFLLTTWQCRGPESELAFITEDFFDKYNFNKKYGYRFQTGTVEIKLWHEKNSVIAENAIKEFNDIIKPFLKD